MLTLTENAATAVKSIVSQLPQPGEGGLRIRDTGTPDTGFELVVVPTPEPADQVVETEGARVFLDEGAGVALGDRVLDAQIAEDGGVRFALATQA